MEIIFDTAGKFKNGTVTIFVTANDVKNKKVFEVKDKNAQNYINAEKAHEKGSHVKNKKEEKKEK